MRLGAGRGVIQPAVARRGFTLLELLVALTLGAIVLAAAVAYMMRELRTLSGSEIRQALARNVRYVGVSLTHDVQKAGFEFPSTRELGSLIALPGAGGDTLVVLHMPYEPFTAPVYPLLPPPGVDNPLPPGGTCGSRCLDLSRGTNAPVDLAAGDLAVLRRPEGARLLLVEDVVETSETSVALTFVDAPFVFAQPAGLGVTGLDRYETTVQKLAVVVYYLDAEEQLRRAHRLNLDGSPMGDILAYDVEEFDLSLVFADEDVSQQASPLDGDDTNDYDDVEAVRIRVAIRAQRTDPRVNRGEPLRRTYEWTITPRNLRY